MTVQKLLHRAAVWVGAFASLAWLGLFLGCNLMMFESSEYDKCDARWWYEMRGCIANWIALPGFTSAWATALYFRRSVIALLITVISLSSIWLSFVYGETKPPKWLDFECSRSAPS